MNLEGMDMPLEGQIAVVVLVVIAAAMAVFLPHSENKDEENKK